MENTKVTPITADTIDIHVAKRIKTRRIMLGLSQDTLSKELGVSIQQIQKYENGINRISASKLYALAKFLMVPIEFFFDEIGIIPNISPEEGVMATENDTPIPENQLKSLINSYNIIKDISLRKKILELVKSIVK